MSALPSDAQLLRWQRLVEIEAEIAKLRATEERSPAQIVRLEALIMELSLMEGD